MQDYQTVGFHFAVAFTDKSQFGIKAFDARFQSVSGLDVRMDTEDIREGGENRFVHVVPTRRRYSDLVLKRGLMSPSEGSILTSWCLEAFEHRKVVPLNLAIHLLDEKHDILMSWDIRHARPKSWKFGELNAERGEVLIETLELSHNGFTFSSRDAYKQTFKELPKVPNT